MTTPGFSPSQSAVFPDLFLHLPRTGGTTLWTVLNQMYGQSHVLRLLSGTMPGNTAEIHRILTGGATPYRLIGGHFYFDVRLAETHAHRYFTMLRRPDSRAISTYYKIVRREQHRLHDEFIARGVTLEQSLALMPRNLQTRLLANVPDDRDVTEADYAAACQFLRQHFAAVGITERFDESLLLFRRVFGWQAMPYYAVHNSSANRPRDIPAAVYEQANALNAFDGRLYAYATGLFDAQITAQGETFAADLVAFRAGLQDDSSTVSAAEPPSGLDRLRRLLPRRAKRTNR